MVYWYSTSVFNDKHKLSIIETSHFMSLDVAPEPTSRKTSGNRWNMVIDTALTKFETNNRFKFVPD
jgi:hypothetical protein